MLLLEGHTDPVFALAFSPDGLRLASGTRDGAAWLWDELGGHHELLAPDPVRPRPVNAIAFHPDGDALVLGGGMGWIGRRGLGPDGFHVFGPPKGGPVTDVRFLSPSLLAVGRGDRAKQEPGSFELWDVTTSTRKEPYYPAPLGVRAVAVVPHRKRVAWLEWGRKLAVWDIVKPSAQHVGLAQNAIALAFRPDGNALALASGWEVQTYDLEAKAWRATLKGHKGVVPCVAYSPDGRTLATGSWDGSVRFWDPHSGLERAAFQWPVGRVYALAFSPDGLRVAAAGDAGSIVLWDAA